MNKKNIILLLAIVIMSIWTVKIKAEENQNPRFMDMFGCIVMCSIENNCIDNTPCSIEAEDGVNKKYFLNK